MKKVFNVSLLAASVAMAFSAQAVVIQPTANSPVLSNQGIEVGEVSQAPIIFDVTVQKEHPAGSEVVLTFSDTVDLENVVGGGCDFTGGGNVGNCGGITFDVGNGNFTFDNVVVDADEGTITYNVNLGNSLIANSAFRVRIADAEISGSASVAYASNLAGNTIEESNNVTIASTEDQFALALDGAFSQLIERDNRVTFVDSTTEDAITLTYENNTALAAGATAEGLTVVVEGNFTEGNAGSEWTLMAGGGNLGASDVTETALTFTIPSTDLVNDSTFTLDFNGTNGDELQATQFTVSAELEFSGADGSDEVELLDEAAAGQWRLDASVVNVPYLPINYGFTPNVEVANQGLTPAEISIEAIDNQTGERLPAQNLVHRHTGEAIVVGANSLVTVTEGDIVRSLDLGDARRKVSLTFVINADEEDITLVPYYREGESRINVLTDQYKGQ